VKGSQTEARPGKIGRGPSKTRRYCHIRECGTNLAAQNKREIVIWDEKGREEMMKKMSLLVFTTLILFV
jgi:hypothetical protein